MRTPLVWTLSVTISPWYSSLTFLKEPMLAMSLLLAVRARDHRGLDGDLQAGDDRRRTRLRAGAQRRMPSGRLSCLARNGRSPGEESRGEGVAAQAIEAQPVCGQIHHNEACVSRAEQPGEKKTWPISAIHKRSASEGQ